MMAGGAGFNLFGLTEARFETLLLIALRVGFMLGLVPVFSARQIPIAVRIGLAFLITYVVAQTVPTLAGPLDLGALVVAIMAQMFIGLVFGFVAFLIFTGIQFAGEILDIQVGFGAVNILNPTTQQQVTIIGEFQLAMATLIYLVSDSHHYLFQGIGGSFAILPLPYAAIDPLVGRDLVGFFTQALFLIFKISGPVAIVLIIVNISLGLLARVAPQMNVFVVGLPIQIGIGLIMILVSLPLFGTVLPQVFAETPRQFDAVLRAMAPSPAPRSTASP